MPPIAPASLQPGSGRSGGFIWRRVARDKELPAVSAQVKPIRPRALESATPHRPLIESAAKPTVASPIPPIPTPKAIRNSAVGWSPAFFTRGGYRAC